jgi:hypothetical protein
MKEYTYPIFFKFLYRYANLPLTLLLIILLIPLVVNLDNNILLMIPLIITLMMIYFLNRFYITLYKIIPYKIFTDEDRIICKDFLLSHRREDIFFKEIESLNGGIFEGRINGVMKINSKNNVSVGFYHSMNNANEFESFILSKVDRRIYDEIVNKVGIKSRQGIS